MKRLKEGEIKEYQGSALGLNLRRMFVPRVLFFVFLGVLFATTTSLTAVAQISFVQVRGTTGGSGTSSITATYSSAQTAGNMNIVAIGWFDATTTVTSVTDTNGNTYRQAASLASSAMGMTVATYYAGNIVAAAAGANTVTVNFNTGASFPDLRILEYSGVNTLDVTASGTGTATTADSGGATTTQASELLFGSNYSVQNTNGPGSGYTSRLIDAFSEIVEDEVVSASGTYHATAAMAKAGNWIMQLATFYKSGGGSPPPAPTGLTATAVSSSQINLSWTASSGATSYNVLRSTTNGGPYTQIASGVTTTSYSNRGLAASTTYFYVTQAVSGGGTSGNSNQASATAQAGPPPAPTNLTATAGNTQVSLSWTASSGATSYNVLRSTTNGGPYTQIASGVTTTSYTDTGLNNGTTYFYVVQAVSGGGTSGNSNQASATPNAPPPAPTGLTATAVSSSQINLSWTASSGATSYNVLRSTTNGGPYTQIASGQTATIYSNTGLAASTTYFYVVLAVNSGGTSDNSNQASATTQAAGSGISISIIPYNAGVVAGQSWSFTANVSNDSANRGVTWSVSCGTPPCGSISPTSTASGVATTYTAPSLPSSTLSVTVTATSVSDTTVSKSSTVTVPAINVLGVWPNPASVVAGQTGGFSAIVLNDPAGTTSTLNWTVSGSGCSGAGCGSLSPTSTTGGASVTYTAPTTIPSSAVTITATSATDTNKSASATITITSAGGGPIVWVVPDILERVYPTDAPGNGTTATLNCARGEYCAFQVGVQAPFGGLTNVSISASNLSGPGGTSIASTNVILYREIYNTPSAHSTTLHGPPNLPLTGQSTFPDGLVPFIDPATGQPPTSGAQFTPANPSVAAGNNTVFWVDVFVPRGTGSPAGSYTGTYTVTSGQGSVTGSINVNVWNFTLPLRPSMYSLFNSGSSSPTGTNSELLRNKIVNDGELVPTSVSSTTQNNDISTYGLNYVNLGFFDGTGFGNGPKAHCTPKTAPTISSVQAAAVQQNSALRISDYSGDPESGCSGTTYWNAVIQWGSNIHQGGSFNLRTETPVPQLFNDGSGRTAVDDWSMEPDNTMFADPANVNFVLGQPNNQVWSYNGLVGEAWSPKWEVDFPPIDYRVQSGFISQGLWVGQPNGQGNKGLMYWAATCWGSGTPWTDLNVCLKGFPGEGILVLPGSNAGLAGLAPTMRLKYLRDGVQDYEYMQLLKNCGQTAFEQSVGNPVATSMEWGYWTTDDNVLLSARTQLGNQISSSSCAP